MSFIYANNINFEISIEEEKDWLLNQNVWDIDITPTLLNCALRLCCAAFISWQNFLSSLTLDISCEDLFKVSVVAGGLTNKLYKCELFPVDNTPLPEPPCVLLRIYGVGTEKLFDKSKEIKRSVELGEARIGPKIYYNFGTGRIEQWIPGKSLNRLQLKEEYIFEQIADQMALFHTFEEKESEPSSFPSLLLTLDSWLSDAKISQPKFRNEREV